MQGHNEGVFGPITFFTDEVSQDFAEQAAFGRRVGLDALDLRSMGGRSAVDLTPEDIAAVKAEGVPVQCLATFVSKVPLEESRHEEMLAALGRGIANAKALGTMRIRIFSPEPLDDRESAWPAVKAWLRPMVDLAEKEGVMLLHENDGEFYGAYPAESERVMGEFYGPSFKAAFDFANTVMTGHRAMDDWFPMMTPYLDTLHIKDAVAAEKRVVPAGEGDGQVLETLRYLKNVGWSGPLTLEPHLQVAGTHGGFSGAELGQRAYDALQKVLAQVEG